MDDRHYRQGAGWRPGGIRPVRAFTLIEVLVAAFIMVIMAMMVAAVVPIATRGTHMSRSYSQAILVAQRKIDQMQSAGYSALSGSTISDDYKIVDDSDNNPATPASSTGTTGDGYLTFPFTNRDNLADVLGPNATGVIEIRPWGGAGLSGTGGLLGVRVRLTWREGDKATQSTYMISTLITKMPMNN